MCEWTKRASFRRQNPVNEEEISEAFARERTKVNGGHQVLNPEKLLKPRLVGVLFRASVVPLARHPT